MKKIFLLSLAILMIESVSFAANTYTDSFAGSHSFATKTIEAHDTMVIRADYDVRTDGQPVYLGFAVSGTATSADAWIIYKFTYDGDSQMTLRQSTLGIWDNRASLTYQ